MALKMFTENDSRSSVAINPDSVSFVREVYKGTLICMSDGSKITVNDTFLDTITKLNEKK